MNTALPVISLERLLARHTLKMLNYRNKFLVVDDFADLSILEQPTRLQAVTLVVCLQGEVECSINLRRYRVSARQLLVNFSGDIIQVHKSANVKCLAVIVSEEYLQSLRFDFRERASTFLALCENGPVNISEEDLHDLLPYRNLIGKNIIEDNDDVVTCLVQALAHTIIAYIRKRHNMKPRGPEATVPRPRRIFEKFMGLLSEHHSRERSLSFYADKMYLTPKYVSRMVKTYSGKRAIDWISEYVIAEACIMLAHTDLTIQEIAYRLNFPTQSAFGKYFKQVTGRSPKHYRFH